MLAVEIPYRKTTQVPHILHVVSRKRAKTVCIGCAPTAPNINVEGFRPKDFFNKGQQRLFPENMLGTHGGYEGLQTVQRAISFSIRSSSSPWSLSNDASPARFKSVSMASSPDFIRSPQISCFGILPSSAI